MSTPSVIFLKIGQRFGKWKVVRAGLYTPAGLNTRPRRAARVRCTCGTERVTAIYHLLYGNSKGCGCQKYPGSHKYINRWLTQLKISFGVPEGFNTEAILDEVGERPSPDHYLALCRVVGKKVMPDDIVWCLGRPNIIGSETYKVGGQWMSLKYGATKLGMSYQGLKFRLRSGWSVERAFMTPKGS